MGYETKVILTGIHRYIQETKDWKKALHYVEDIANSDGIDLKSSDDDEQEKEG